ncbi:MAG TPA: ATPase, partial [Gemmatales bacterium]|nr:ATPase [Gemmatales bacterium]
MKTRPIDRIVALDDFDIELGAALREYFRLPDFYETTARHFRDKLTMRTRARDLGVPVPDFVGAFNNDDIRDFLNRVPGPWLLKPRGSANAIGIQKLSTAEEVFQALEKLGDDQSCHLLEQMIPGELYHLDSIVSQGQVKFAEVNKYAKPLFDVYHGGGIYMTRTLPRNKAVVATLRKLNEIVLLGFGLHQGVSHTEYMHNPRDDKFYLIETSARVGGANIAEMVEAATGVNLWSEWAKVEIDRDVPYTPPVTRQLHAG